MLTKWKYMSLEHSKKKKLTIYIATKMLSKLPKDTFYGPYF